MSSAAGVSRVAARYGRTTIWIWVEGFIRAVTLGFSHFSCIELAIARLVLTLCARICLNSVCCGRVARVGYANSAFALD